MVKDGPSDKVSVAKPKVENHEDTIAKMPQQLRTIAKAIDKMIFDTKKLEAIKTSFLETLKRKEYIPEIEEDENSD